MGTADWPKMKFRTPDEAKKAYAVAVTTLPLGTFALYRDELRFQREEYKTQMENTL